MEHVLIVVITVLVTLGLGAIGLALACRRLGVSLPRLGLLAHVMRACREWDAGKGSGR